MSKRHEVVLGGVGAETGDGQAINLNGAPRDVLASLPMLGPSLAKALVQHRPHRSWDEIEQIPGFDQFITVSLQTEGAYLGQSPKVKKQ